jgi:DNA topoisomerase-1
MEHTTYEEKIMKLVIVESPGKIKTIQGILGSDYRVVASFGHCFQISPKNNAIDIKNNYEPEYIVIPKKKSVIKEIKDLAARAEVCYIASDADREGEAIGWHIAKAIKNTCPVKRILFREITKTAVLAGLNSPGKLDENKFYSQQARSVLDFLVGFKVSPVLWSKVCRGTSAGRVQSIGLEIIVERQREIDKFKPEEYWDITGNFSTKAKEDFSATYKAEEKLISEAQVKDIITSINCAKQWNVKSLVKASKTRSPQQIFTTSTLQQFCSSSFGWDGKKTMKLAQSLYEGFAVGGHETTGLITYHRTDSVNISTEAITAVRDFIQKDAGKKYLPAQPKVFKSKGNAQEAHEGIRPAHLEFNLKDIRSAIPEDECKLYEAIFYRFVSCQAVDAEFDVVKATIISDNNTFVANGQTLSFDGFLKYWPYSTTKDEMLPVMNEKDIVILKDFKGNQHFTKPPASFNTASFIKFLDEKGIGRPSTYATIVDTLLKRGYVIKDAKAFKPTELGNKICDFLLQAFPELMNTNYTARMETELDEIAEENKVWYTVVDGFYKELSRRISDAKVVEKSAGITDIECPACHKHKLVKRFSRFGQFYGCEGYKDKGDDQCKATFKIDADGQPVEKIKKEVRYIEDCVCDKCGSKIVIRTGIKSGKEFGGCSGFPKCRRMFSLDGKPIEFAKKKFYGKKGKKKVESSEDE